MDNRYARNQNLISAREQEKLAAVTAAVIGLGGLGGHIAEQLARLGVGTLILVDDDTVDPSNLNRQVFATEAAIGVKKTQAAQNRILTVNSSVRLRCWDRRLDEDNAAEILHGAEIVFDAVDNIPTRLLLEKTCRQLGLPLMHGAIGGWYGQVSFVAPGDDTLSRFYPPGAERGVEKKLGTPAFIAALIASLQVAEALKYLLGRGELLRRKVLRVDLLTQDYRVLQMP